MILDLKALFAGDSPIQVDYSFRPEEDQLPNVSLVHVTGRLVNEADIVMSQLSASFEMPLLCDRCMSEYVAQYNFPVEHVLVTSLNHEDEDRFILVEQGQLDVDELVVSDILLSLPMKHLCLPDCKGLCPTCGRNLNEGPCGCKKPIDPRLEALGKLLE
ncbi:DUF177 domain-containing protein [[Clostridium] leptum]|nr:DUF177 domain-containing protein [[Clostridium] leptum]